MFLETSRYAGVRRERVTTRSGRTVTVVSPRRLPATTGEPYTVTGGERLDVIAQALYDDPTRFWHIADANTEIVAGALVAEPGRAILAPRS